MEVRRKARDFAPQEQFPAAPFARFGVRARVRHQLGRLQSPLQIAALNNHLGVSINSRFSSFFASNSQAFEVPSGISRIEAISECLNPSTSNNMNTMRWRGLMRRSASSSATLSESWFRGPHGSIRDSGSCLRFLVA